MAILKDRFPIYSRLLNLYPPAYRHRYGPQMLQTLADMLDNAPTRYERSMIRLQVALDLPVSLIRQDINYIGGIMRNDMPTYLKRNALIGAVMLVPFTLALIANSLDKLLYHHTLYNSWLWHAPLLGLWVLWLPLLATVLALTTFLVYLLRASGTTLRGVVRLESTWPILGVLIASVGILAILFGHDSVHCILGNPIHELQQPTQTWQCISQGASNYPFQHPIEFLRRIFFGHN